MNTLDCYLRRTAECVNDRPGIIWTMGSLLPLTQPEASSHGAVRLRASTDKVQEGFCTDSA